MQRALFSLFFAASVTLATTQAQVIHATDDASDADNFKLDVGGGTTAGPIWTGAGAWGAAADDVNDVMYINDGTVLYGWDYNDPNPAANLGTLVNVGSTTANSVLGLAYYNGVLYSVDSATTDDILSVDLVTLEMTSVYQFFSSSASPGGLAADPTTGLFYYTQDSTSSLWMDSFGNTGSGTVQVNLTTQTELKLLDYPAAIVGANDIDGCSFDPSGVVYLIEDQAAPLHNFNVTTLAYDPNPPMSGILANEVFSSGAYSNEVGDGSTIGTNYCTANPNSTGATGVISAFGSSTAASNDLTVTATDLPPLGFGFFIVSETSGFVMNPAGSAGNLCLSGSIGRYVGPGQIQNTGVAGEISLVLDLTAIPQPLGAVSVSAGDTWNFQAWHRDSSSTGPTSNFTDGIEIVFN